MAKNKRKKQEDSVFENVIFEVTKMDDLRLRLGKDSPDYEKQHQKVVKTLNQYNSTVPKMPKYSRKFSMSMSLARNIIQSRSNKVEVSDGK
jgi:hypothetical protein